MYTAMLGLGLAENRSTFGFMHDYIFDASPLLFMLRIKAYVNVLNLSLILCSLLSNKLSAIYMCAILLYSCFIHIHIVYHILVTVEY